MEGRGPCLQGLACAGVEPMERGPAISPTKHGNRLASAGPSPILALEESMGDRPIPGLEAGFFLGQAVLDEEYPVVSLKQPEAQFHKDPHGC
jgi:hypothetical protein